MKHKGLWISLIAVFFTLAAVYFAGVFFFSHNSLPYTYIKGIDEETGWKKPEEITRIISDALPETLAVSFPDGLEFRIELDAFRDHDRINSTGQEIVDSQDHWRWPLEILKNQYYSYTTYDFFDEESMRSEIRSYSQLYDSGTPAENAYIEIDPDNLEYTMEEEIEGTKIRRDVFEDNIVDFLYSQDVFADDLTVVLSKDVYFEPEITIENEDLNTDLNWLNYVVNRSIDIDLDGKTESIRTGDFCDLQVLMDTGELVINRDLVNSYVNWYGDTYDTLDQDRVFKNHNGEEILVGGRWDEYSNYGYLMDREATAELVYEALCSNKIARVEAVWESKGHSHYGGQSDIGMTYIEISLDEQHLWYYKNGSLFLETDVVTGLPMNGRNTSRGVFEIYSEGTHVNLKGMMNGETWDSWVDFWFSVTYSQIGIHDAPWRTEFGGDIYKTNGSHGCINVPRPAMEMLYNNAGIGTIVVIY